MQTSAPSSNGTKHSVFEGVTFYHWLVVIIASFGWLFDCMDQAIFSLARHSALTELLRGDGDAMKYATYATTSMLLGWATGGIIFGMLSDKWGRVKTMVATLVIYSGFTGLSGIAQSEVDFIVYRFLVGLGVGGMFGAATTLVAESVPGGFRAIALGSLQALSATGNIIGGLIAAHVVQPGAPNVWGELSGWRVIFFVGVVPALLVVPMIIFLREPEAWRRAKEDHASGKTDKKVGSLADLFGDPRWRKNAFVGLLLGVSGMVGLWGVGFFSPELVTTALKDTPLKVQDIKQPQQICIAIREEREPATKSLKSLLSASNREQLGSWDESQPVSTNLLRNLVGDLNLALTEGSLYENAVFQKLATKESTTNLLAKIKADPQQAKPRDIAFLNRQLLEQAMPGQIALIQEYIDRVRGNGFVLQQVGAFFGMLAFTFVASFLNRRIAFLGSFILCLLTTMFVFKFLRSESDAYWMLPMMGFAQLAVFAGYSIYFPELFPTRLRGTGVGFCYNTVRYLAAPFPALLGYLSGFMSFRTAAIAMSTIYILGIVALIWAPETKGKPLPED